MTYGSYRIKHNIVLNKITTKCANLAKKEVKKLTEQTQKTHKGKRL